MADAEMRDADAIEEEERQYAQGPLRQDDLDIKYPHRPHNRSRTLPFHDLHLTLFNPLKEIRKGRAGPMKLRLRSARHPTELSPQERRRLVIQKFIARWRQDVGDDFYPAFRLIVPEKDRDRAMYGLKEKIIAKVLVRVLRIDKNSPDALNLINWKLPGRNQNAGDFAARCFEVLSKRPIRTEVGDMTIADVNERLDLLSTMSKEDEQLPIFQEFYSRMNAEEMMWLIRMILRQMKIGATERTFLELWHPDAESLFNVSSSLRRVCWELYDPKIRLEDDDRGINLMSSFQPQLAAFQLQSFDRMVSKMRLTDEGDVFWIEEKLDGERMQLHMMQDGATPGGKKFGFWSRRAKEYTYLYGSGIEDEQGSLTRHLQDAFADGVRNIILDGEMITWDMEEDAMLPFGTLKTAALSEQRNPYTTTQRPLFRVFDCLYLNDKALTSYTLRDRRNALEASVHSVHRRMEVHDYSTGTTARDIELQLRRVVEEASEGLVIKNPKSSYRLNDRNEDWMKVKPEYMTEFGESMDCIVIGGYYGSGHRGGAVSSFLCGLRLVDKPAENDSSAGMKCFSFCKVGGGMTADDYKSIRHHTDGRWQKWDPRSPPTDFIELSGGSRQFMRPDVWIKPSESVVFSIKAASVGPTDQFRVGLTLRFPRFKKLRLDKDWTSALSLQDFKELKESAEKEKKDKQFVVDESRRKRQRVTKKTMNVAGADDYAKGSSYSGPTSQVFAGLTFYIMTDSLSPQKRTKADLEQLVKAHGGSLVQTASSSSSAKDKDHDIICIADRPLPRVTSLIKSASRNILRPLYLFDCIAQSQPTPDASTALPLPYEPRHMLYLLDADHDAIDANTDDYGDSFARDVGVDELRDICTAMALRPRDSRFDAAKFLAQLEEREGGAFGGQVPCGWTFKGLVVYLDFPARVKADGDGGRTKGEVLDEWVYARQMVEFGAGEVVDEVEDERITHFVVGEKGDAGSRKELRRRIAEGRAGDHRKRVPWVVSLGWVMESWRERTLLDEERFVVR